MRAGLGFIIAALALAACAAQDPYLDEIDPGWTSAPCSTSYSNEFDGVRLELVVQDGGGVLERLASLPAPERDRITGGALGLAVAIHQGGPDGRAAPGPKTVPLRYRGAGSDKGPSIALDPKDLTIALKERTAADIHLRFRLQMTSPDAPPPPELAALIDKAQWELTIEVRERSNGDLGRISLVQAGREPVPLWAVHTGHNSFRIDFEAKLAGVLTLAVAGRIHGATSISECH